MDSLSKLKKLENIHILFWLFKDGFWMLNFQTLAIIMVIPTIIIAIINVFIIKQELEILIHLAILCWILANCIWMFNEFYVINYYKYYASAFFSLGILFMFLYFLRLYRKTV